MDDRQPRTVSWDWSASSAAGDAATASLISSVRTFLIGLLHGHVVTHFPRQQAALATPSSTAVANHLDLDLQFTLMTLLKIPTSS